MLKSLSELQQEEAEYLQYREQQRRTWDRYVSKQLDFLQTNLWEKKQEQTKPLV